MNYQKEVKKLLKKYGEGPKWRSGKHWKQQLKNGKTVTLAGSPSDVNYWMIKLQDIRRALGLSYTVPKVEERKVKKLKRRKGGTKLYHHLKIAKSNINEPPPGPDILPAPMPKIYGKVRGIRLGREVHRKDKGIVYSPDIIAHVNMLRATQGEQAVTNYLNSVKENTMEVGNKGTKVVSSPLQLALNESREKIAFYAQEVQRCQKEMEKWVKAEQALRSAMGIISGEVPVQKEIPKAATVVRGPIRKVKAPVNGKVDKRSGLREETKEKLVKAFEGIQQPRPKKEFQDILRKQNPKLSYTMPYGWVASGLKSGFLIEVDGNLALASWTEPQREVVSIGQESGAID